MVELKDRQQQKTEGRMQFHSPDCIDGMGSVSLLGSILSAVLLLDMLDLK